MDDRESGPRRERSRGLDSRPPDGREDFDHFCYFRLINAFSHEGCPVCTCLKRSAHRYLDSLFYESVNDVGVRAALRHSGGFCNWHSWMATKLPNSQLGLAVIAEDLFGHALRQLRRTRFGHPRGRLRGWLLSWLFRGGSRFRISIFRKHKAPCPACEQNRVLESSYLEGMLQYIEDPQFERTFDRSPGLCIPHFLRLAELYPAHPHLEIVARQSERKWAELQGQLKSFAAKHSYDAAKDFSEEEARSWKLAVEILSGGEGIFGNELRQDPPPGGRSPATHVLHSGHSNPSVGAPGSPESLQFEAEKLKLRVEELRSQLFATASEASSLHYRLWQALEEKKELERNLSAARADSRLQERLIEQLRDKTGRPEPEQGTDSRESPE